MTAAVLLGVLVVGGLVVGAFFDPVAVALRFVTAGLALVGAVSLYLHLGEFLDSWRVRAATVVALAGTVTVALATTPQGVAGLLWIVPYLAFSWLGLDQLTRWGRVGDYEESFPYAESGSRPSTAPRPRPPSEDHHRRCRDDDNKRIFETEYDAARAVYRSQQRWARGDRTFEKPLTQHYHCRFAQHWHVSSGPVL